MAPVPSAHDELRRAPRAGRGGDHALCEARRAGEIIGVDCGFVQGLATARVHPSIMWEKFRMLFNGARLASRRLWP